MLQRSNVVWQVARICCRSYSKAEVSGGAAFLKGDVRLAPVNAVDPTKYGGVNTVTLLTGSGTIGQQGAKLVTSLLNSSKVPVDVQHINPKEEQDYFLSVFRNRAAVHVDINADAKSKANALKICNDLDLYMLKTRTRSFPGFNCRFPGVDIQMIGQNNMGNYSELEYTPVKGVVEALSVNTRGANRQYLNYAFAAAVRAGRKRVTLITKVKEWPLVDGALVADAVDIHKEEYEACLELELMEVEECISRLVTNPAYFDCLFASDRYCTFLSTICSGVCGGANLFSAVETGDTHAVFKPLQTKLSLTNYNNLSAYGIISTIVDLFEHLGYHKKAKDLWDTMVSDMDEGIKTTDFGGKDSDEFVVCNIINKLNKIWDC